MYLPNWMILNSEKKIRRHWLAATSIFFIFCPLNMFIGSVFEPRQAPISEQEVYKALAATIIGLIAFCLSSYCIYKKSGTKLLTFWLVVTPFTRLSEILEVLSEIPSIETLVALVIDIAIFLWWYRLSFKLRQINKAAQTQRFLEPQVSLDEAKTSI